MALVDYWLSELKMVVCTLKDISEYPNGNILISDFPFFLIICLIFYMEVHVH